MCPDKDTVVAVLQMYDNSFYFTRTEDGNMVHPKRGKDDKFHVVGESVLAPKKMHYNAFKQSLQVLEAVKDVKKIVLSPLPRYWDSSCCDNPTHVTNRKEEGYKKQLESTVYKSKENIRAFIFRHGTRNCKVVNPWPLVKKVTPLWSKGAVHLTEEGYEELAFGVAGAAEDLGGKRQRRANSILESKEKRSRLEQGGRGPDYTTSGSNNNRGGLPHHGNSRAGSSQRSYINHNRYAGRHYYGGASRSNYGGRGRRRF